MNRTKEIEAVAAELGYTEAMGVSALDYIIETAKASVMVNQKNFDIQREINHIQMLSDANNRMVQKLQDERSGLMAQLKSIRAIFRSENLSQNETAVALQKLASVVDELPEQCLRQVKADAVLKFSALLLVNQKIDVIDAAKGLADELNQGAEL